MKKLAAVLIAGIVFLSFSVPVMAAEAVPAPAAPTALEAWQLAQSQAVALNAIIVQYNTIPMAPENKAAVIGMLSTQLLQAQQTAAALQPYAQMAIVSAQQASLLAQQQALLAAQRQAETAAEQQMYAGAAAGQALMQQIAVQQAALEQAALQQAVMQQALNLVH